MAHSWFLILQTSTPAMEEHRDAELESTAPGVWRKCGIWSIMGEKQD